MIVSTTSRREMVHWIELWILVALAVAVMQGVLAGQAIDPKGAAPVGEPVLQISPNAVVGSHAADVDAKGPGSAIGATEEGSETQEGGTPIPMPNIDRPDWFHYPSLSPAPVHEGATLTELLVFHRAGDYRKALRGWLQVRMTADSETWRSVGIGVALLRMDRLDEATEHLERAITQDPDNAVAEYFLGRVRQAQARQVPFWYEPDQTAPFRLASSMQATEVASATSKSSFEQRGRERPKQLLPHFIDDTYRRMAKQHFRRAVTLAPKCNLDRVIRVVVEQPSVIQLTSQRGGGEGDKLVTVGDLLDSMGERDYVRKAIAEVGAPPT